MRPAIAAAIALLVACASEEAPRQRHEDDHGGYVVAYPRAWTISRERGAAVFISDDQRHRIIIRSATRPPEVIERKPTAEPDVYAATAQVLRSLPQARVSEPKTIEHPTLRGARFRVTFTPLGKQAHQRMHVTLVGAKRVFHVIHTAPTADELDETAFNQMVSSLREKV